MMTTMAALLGAVPIALGYGAGGEARQPLGLVVVGGLLFSQLVTLYLTPVFYTYMAQVQSWLKGSATPRSPKAYLPAGSCESPSFFGCRLLPRGITQRPFRPPFLPGAALSRP